MSAVLIVKSKIVCNHGGSVSPGPGAPKLTIQGQKVLLRGDVAGQSMSSCTTPNDPSKGLKTCTTVSAVTPGDAKKLRVQGERVLLDTLTGMSNGTPENALSVQQTAQQKLTAK